MELAGGRTPDGAYANRYLAHNKLAAQPYAAGVEAAWEGQPDPRRCRTPPAITDLRTTTRRRA